MADKPDFSSITSVEERKNAFFTYFYPHILHANLAILEERKSILLHGATKSICAKYRVDCEHQSAKEELLTKVNIILPSQALAQAAIESSWGRSRFAKQANNYFGVWCWTPQCGITPLLRPSGESYWVKSYPDVEASISDFMLNLNRHHAYSEFRNVRRQSSSNALSQAARLTAYSQEKEAYVKKVQSTMSFNKLSRFDKQFNHDTSKLISALKSFIDK